MKNKNGFTLLELLVVVLIIGILAAIALPQYQSSVRKARVAEAKITLRALVDATDRYFLQKGNTNWDFSQEDLDVQVPEETNNWSFTLEECYAGGCYADAAPKWESGYSIEFYSANYGGGEDEYCGKFTCYASNDNGHNICKSLGGQSIEGYNNEYFI